MSSYLGARSHASTVRASHSSRIAAGNASRLAAAGLAVFLTIGFAGTAHATPDDQAMLNAGLVEHCHNGTYIWISPNGEVHGHADHRPDDNKPCTALTTPDAEEEAKKAADEAALKAAEEAAAQQAEDAAAALKAAEDAAAAQAEDAAAALKAAEDAAAALKAAEEAAAKQTEDAAAALKTAEEAAAKQAEDAAAGHADDQPSVPSDPPAAGGFPPRGGDAADDHIVTVPVVGLPVIVVPDATAPMEAVDTPDDEPAKPRTVEPIEVVDAVVLGDEAVRPAGSNGPPAATADEVPATGIEVLPAQRAIPREEILGVSDGQVNRPAVVVLPQTGLGDDLGMLAGIGGTMLLVGGMTVTAGRRRSITQI